MSYKEKSYLIVDDMKVLRNILKNILVKFEINEANIYQAENGKEAIEILKSKPVDLILSDWNMPEVNGLEFLRHCRSSEKHKKTPFIMVTAESERDQIVEAVGSVSPATFKTGKKRPVTFKDLFIFLRLEPLSKLL